MKLTMRPALLVTLLLALPALTLHPLNSAAASGPAPRRLLASAEEKQRVPKPPASPPKPAPDKPASSSDSSDDGNADFFSSCLSDCLGSCVEGMFQSLWTSVTSGRKAAPALADSARTPAPQPFGSTTTEDTLHVEAPYEPHAWVRYDVGYLRAYVPGDSVVLRRSATDPDSARLEAGRLPDEARVLVLTTRVGPGGTMLEVRGVDAPSISGWVHQKQVQRTATWSASTRDTMAAWSAAEPDSVTFTGLAPDTLAGANRTAPRVFSPAAPEVAQEDERAAQARARWAIALAIGGAVIDNPELDAEYSNGGMALEAEYLRCTARAWSLGAGAGYRGFSGSPQVEYHGATEIDSPMHSRFRLTYAMAEFGQRHAWANRLRFGYLAGPVVGYVFEDANVLILDANTRVPIGGRHDRLGRWAGGGGATAWVGSALPIPIELGLRVRILGLAWAGRHQKSLTSDYTDAGLLHLDAALTLTHAGR